MVTIDEIGNLTVLNYPSSWQGKARIVRFGGSNAKKPFSDEFCQIVRGSASSGYGKILVRGAYHSELIFELLPFLSLDFMSAVREAARVAGIPNHYSPLIKPVEADRGELEVTFTDNAISHYIGRYQELFNQINLSRAGTSKGSSEHMVIVTSGDIICDLISGDATMTMIYPIRNDDRVIRVTYGPLEVKLNPRP